MTAQTTRTARKDVTRNRALLLNAADELFTQRGVDTTLDDIARHAGVGVATAYRHFENKRALLEALFEDRISKVLTSMEAAEALTDPRESFEALLYGIAEMQAQDRGTREVMAATHGLDNVSAIRDRIQPVADRIVQRARAAAILRPEFETLDLPLIVVIMGTVSDYAGSMSPQLWRRYLDFLLDGIVAESVPRRTVTIPPLDQQQVDLAMHCWHTAR